MGFFGGWLFSKSETWLLAEKEKINAKKERLQSEIKSLDDKIVDIDRALLEKNKNA